MPQLILTADDCGLSQGINLAALEHYQRGEITAASIMTNFPAHEHAFELFSKYPDLEIGAHLTLSDGRPVTDIASPSPLTDADGSFRHKVNMYSRLLFPSDTAAVYVRHELEAQLRKFTDAGIQPQHITTHRHFHTVPALRKVVYELAILYKIKWVRAHEFRATLAPYTVFAKAQSPAGNLPFSVPAYLSPLKHWMTRGANEYAERLISVEDTIEMIIHPSLAEDDSFPDVEYSPAERHEESLFLTQVMEQLRQRQTQTVGTI